MYHHHNHTRYQVNKQSRSLLNIYRTNCWFTGWIRCSSCSRPISFSIVPFLIRRSFCSISIYINTKCSSYTIYKHAQVNYAGVHCTVYTNHLTFRFRCHRCGVFFFLFDSSSCELFFALGYIVLINDTSNKWNNNNINNNIKSDKTIINSHVSIIKRK